MFEIKRILLNRKTLMLIIVITLLNFILFSLNCDSNRDITVQGDDLRHYVENVYPEFLAGTAKQAETLSQIKLSGEPGSFIKRNIKKTGDDFKKLSGVQAVYGENRGIVLFSDYHLTDIIFLGIILLLVFGFDEENSKGLKFIIRTTVKGRMCLAVYRVIGLVIGTAAMAVLLYGGNILAAYISFGDMELTRPIQSVPEFMRCSFNISIGQYFIYQTLLKCVAVLAAAVLLYLFISIFNSLITAIAFAALTVASLMLYSLILPTSSLNILKFANIVALLKTDDFFREYCNLNIFGIPVGMLVVSLIFAAILLIIASIFAIAINGRIYDKPAAVPLYNVTDKLSSFLSKKRPQLPLFLWEGLKILIYQKGIVFIAICFLIPLSSALKYRYLYAFDKFELDWHKKYDGVITRELLNEMNDEHLVLSEKLERATEELDKYLREGGSPYTIGYMNAEKDRNNLEKQVKALERIIETTESGLQYYEETGRKVWLIKPYSYEMLLKDDIKTVQRNTLYILLGIIGAFAAVMSYERQNGMTLTIRTAYRGRLRLIAIKLLWIFVISVSFALAVHFIQFFQISSSIMQYNDLSVPIQSLSFMRDFPIYISIRLYLILLYALRAGAAFACGIFVSLVSSFRNDSISVMGICVLCVIVPYVLMIL